jgi:hypothetical protein
MPDYKLPICWLSSEEGGSCPASSESAKSQDEVNPDCHCFSVMQAFFCMEGHMTECHAGKLCEEAECSHYQRQKENEENE